MSVLSRLVSVFPSIIEDAPKLLYAKYETAKGACEVVLAFTDRKTPLMLQFQENGDGDRWWDDFCEFMTTSCSPACIEIGKALVQPGYLIGIRLHSNEVAHFVIFEFVESRNVWLGYLSRNTQLCIGDALKMLLEHEFRVLYTPPTTLQ